MVLRTSNQAFFNILDAIPRENIGWWLEVYDINNVNTLLARIYDFESLTFKVGLNEAGFGSVTVSQTIEAFQGALPNGLPATSLLNGAGWWKFIEDGVERFRGYHSKRRKIVADPLEQGRSEAEDLAVVQVQGSAWLLESAIVLPTAFTAEGAAEPRAFTGTSWANVFLTLFNEAKARGAVVSWITPMFTATNDTKNQLWNDNGDYSVTAGTTLLGMLNDAADAVGFKWFLRHDGALMAAMEFGNNYGDTIRFFEGYDIFRGDDELNAEETFSHIYVEGGTDGAISSASDAATATAWLRRELYINAPQVSDAGARASVATNTLAKLRQALESRKFNVVAYGKDDNDNSLGRRVFVDWTVGDTIGYGYKKSDLSAEYQVMEIGVEVDAFGQFNTEIMVRNKREILVEKLAVLIKRIMGGNTVTGGGNTVSTVHSVMQQMVFTRQTSSMTTGLLNPGGDTFIAIELAPAYRLYDITTSHDARVRLYASESQRFSDLLRPVGDDPDPAEDHGLMFEFIADGGFHTADLSPMVDGFTSAGSNTVPATVDNLGASNAHITVTFTWIRTE